VRTGAVHRCILSSAPGEGSVRRPAIGNAMRFRTPKRAAPTWPSKLAKGLLIVLVVFSGVEGLLRVTLGPPPAPVGVTRAFIEQDHYFEYQSERVQTTYQIPTMPSFEAVSTKPRVAVLGASSVHGGGVHSPLATDTDCWRGEFPALLEETTGLPVLNLGTAGASSGDLVAVLGQMSGFTVDVLVLYTGHCDVGNAYFEQTYRGFDGLTIRTHPWLERSQLFVQYRRLLTPLRERLRSDDSSSDRSPLTAAEIQLIHRDFRRNLRQIVSSCEKNRTSLVMVTPVCDLTFPPVYGTGPEGDRTYDLWSRGMELRQTDPQGAARSLEEARDRSMRPTRAFTSVEHIVREVAQQRDVPLVDARLRMPRDVHGSVPAPWLFIDELHFSERGHAAMAELLGTVVEEAARGKSRE